MSISIERDGEGTVDGIEVPILKVNCLCLMSEFIKLFTFILFYSFICGQLLSGLAEFMENVIIWFLTGFSYRIEIMFRPQC